MLVRIDEQANERTVSLSTQDTACVGEALTARGARWWYSRCNGSGVQFAGTGFPKPVFVAVDGSVGLEPREWLPFEEDEPGGVLLCVESDGRTVTAKTVTPSGIQGTLARFDRGSGVWGAQRGNAIRLGTGSVALITIETSSDDPAHSSLVLRVVQQGEIATTRLAFHQSGWASVAAAAGANGELAVVAAPFDESGVMALTVDPMNPDRATIRSLTQRAVAVPHPGLRLIASGNRFVASWIRLEDHAVQIAEFDRRLVLPALTVGDEAAGFLPGISLGHSPDENLHEVTVFWTTDGAGVMLRRLPDPTTGSLIATDLLHAFSEWVGARHTRSSRLE